MKLDLSVIIQNVISGCVGGLMVMGVAHAQKAPSKVHPEITARRFNLVDEGGAIRGWWSSTKEETALRMTHSNARILLSATDKEAMIVPQFGPFTKGKFPPIASTLIATPSSSDLLLSDDTSNVAVALHAGSDSQFLKLRGPQSSVKVQDKSGHNRAIVGHRENTGDIATITLIDERGKIIWEQK